MTTGEVAHIVMYTHDFLLEETVENLAPHVDRILIARTTWPWEGVPVDLTETDEVVERLADRYGDRLEVYTDTFPDQATQRNFLVTVSRSRGYRGAFIVDCDEVFTGQAFPRIREYLAHHRPRALRVPYLTFIKDASFCIAPPYETGLFYLDLRNGTRFVDRRTPSVPVMVMPYAEPEILHFSYVRARDEEIERKVRSFSAARDTDWDRWLAQVYHRFHPRLRNFHPVEPETWTALEAFDPGRFPEKLRAKLARHGRLAHATHIAGKHPLRLNLGCGAQRMEGYVNIDLYHPDADLRLDIADLSYFEENSVAEIHLKAVLEHIPTFDQEAALREWHRVLQPEGCLRIRSLPDFDEVIAAYQRGAPGHAGPVFDADEAIRYLRGPYDQNNWRGHLHKDIFTKEKLRRLLEAAGFEEIQIENVCAPGEANPVNINATAIKRRATAAPPPRAEVCWEGFHADEGGWRWMTDRGTLRVMGIPEGVEGLLSFDLACGEAAHYPEFPFGVRIDADGGFQRQVQFTVSHQCVRVHAPLPGRWAGPRRVRLASGQSYVPCARGINADVRRLAVRVSNVAVRTGVSAADAEREELLDAADAALGRQAWADASRAYTQVLAADRDSARARSGLGLALLGLGEAAEGVAQLEEAVRLRPDPDRVNDLACGYLHVGRAAEAAHLLRGLLAIAPEHAEARANLERLGVLVGGPAEAGERER